MNLGWLLLRLIIGLTILTLLILSQRFWHRAIWRFTSNVRHLWLRVGLRLVWLAIVGVLIFAFVDAARLGHHHVIPRGTFLPAFVGLWFFCALFAFIAVKMVRGLDRLWHWGRAAHRRRSAARRSSDPPLAPSVESAAPHFAVAELLPNPSRRYFFKTATALAGATPFLGAVYGFAAERLRYRVFRVEIPLAGLPAALDGLRVVQLSDIHLSGYMSREDVRRAVGMANEFAADLAVVTGDFITGAGDPLADCIEELRALRAPLGVWGCNGNHEIYARAEAAAQHLFAQSGMRLLRQENAQLTWRGAPFNLIGVDYQRERTPQGLRAPMLARIEPFVRRDMPNILLSHNPNSFNRAAELGIELTLSGHTHGGQVQVEILDHRFSPARFITDYIAGLYQRPLQDSKLEPRSSALYVNRGLGTVGAPVRLGVPPEITLLTLRRS